MSLSYTQAEALSVSNSPARAFLRAYNGTGTYKESVFTENFSFTVNPDIFEEQFDDTGPTWNAISTDNGEMSFDTALIFDFDYLELISGGLMTRSSVAGGATAVSNQVISANWIDNEIYSVDLVDPSSGIYYIADGEPAITSVTASTTGVLAANDDYFIHPGGNSRSGYSISLNTNGSAGVATTEEITIVYNSPLVQAEDVMDYGGKTNYDPIEGYIETYNRGGEKVVIEFYKAYWSANFAPTFGSSNDPTSARSNFAFTIKPDTNKDVGKQLYRIRIVNS